MKRMRFKIECDLNDGYANAPAYEVDVNSVEELLAQMESGDTFTNDYGVPVPVGAVVTIERVA